MPETNRYHPVQLAALALGLIVAPGCTVTETRSDLTACTDPRPEVCTMDYTPVCALREVSGAEQWKTYSNACTACSDATVVGYRTDACPTDDR